MARKRNFSDTDAEYLALSGRPAKRRHVPKQVRQIQNAVRGGRRGNAEEQITASDALPLDNGVSENLGRNCKVIIAMNGTPMNAFLLLPSNGLDPEQTLRLQFLDTESIASRYRVWCHKSVVGTNLDEFMVLGDGSVADAWRQWYNVFTEYTGLLWIRRFEAPVPGYWRYQRPQWQELQASMSTTGIEPGWMPLRPAASAPPQSPAHSSLSSADESVREAQVDRAEGQSANPQIRTAKEKSGPETSLLQSNAGFRKTEAVVEAQLDDGVFEQFGYNCKVVVNAYGTVYDASLRLKDTVNGVDKFCRLQAIETGNREFFVWLRQGDVGTIGVSKVLGNGEKWGIYKEFYSKFKELCGVSFRDRHMKSTPPGYFKWLENGSDDLQTPIEGGQFEMKIEGEEEVGEKEASANSTEDLAGSCKVEEDDVLRLGGFDLDNLEAQMP